MSKKLTAPLLFACLFLCGGVFANSAGKTAAVSAPVSSSALSQRVHSYPDGLFLDIDERQWYYRDVICAFELGLMNGKENGIFDPAGKVTIAEAVAIAARMHNRYYDGIERFTQSDPWYRVYADYALEKGILASGEHQDFTKNIKRHEIAVLFARALPASYYNAINSVSFVPDVNAASGYLEELLLLYNAGILMGNDSYGTFSPDSEIARSEVSAMINRIAITENRLKKELAVRSLGSAVYLIDDNEHPYSGWDFDNRGQAYTAKGVYASHLFTDVSDTYPTMLKRDFVPQLSGTLTLESNFTVSVDSGGFLYRMTDGDDRDIFRLFVREGKYYLAQRSGGDAYAGEVAGTKSSFKAVLNLDQQTYDAYLNNIRCGSFAFASDAGAPCRLYVGFDEAGTGGADIAGVKLYANYAVNERFLAPFAGIVPADWTVSCASGTPLVKTVGIPDNTFSFEDIYVLRMDNAKGDHTCVSKTFPALTGKIGYETKFLLPKQTSGVSFIIKSGERAIFRVVTDGALLKTAEGNLIRSYAVNVWNTLRVEIDPEKRHALVRFNGKDVGFFALEDTAAMLDGVSIVMATDVAASMSIDDILVFPIPPEPDDYCPIPQPAESAGYHIGLHVCNLWRNGFWRGTNAAWDIVTAFDELTPYMGYYDEGIPEVADWEIKWISEHGIDYQLMCWYGPAFMTEPVKFAGFSQALHDGFFNAKYKEYSKFAIMWENNFTTSVTSEQFRENLVPYWIEYYFTDPSYMTIDNKPVFSIYNFDRLLGYFGGAANAAAEMEYLRQQVKNIGFDDLILLYAGASGANADKIANMESTGAVGAYSYNWGPPSYTSSYQEAAIRGVSGIFADSSKNMLHIPTVGVGFNAVARHDIRTPGITMEEYKKILNWVKHDHLTNTAFYPDQDSYLSKMFLLSCWNEYDEGHYINPSHLHGFGFLDTIRELFTQNPPHTDEKPTERQVSRLQIMAPAHRATLRPLRRYQEDPPVGEEFVIKKWSFENQQQAKEWSLINSSSPSYENGKLTASSAGIDPIIKLPDNALKMDTKQIRYVHVRFKASPQSGKTAENAQVFFTTDKGGSWAAGQSVSADVKTGETVDAYFYMPSNPSWTGTLSSLRFDPMTEKGAYEVELIELLCDKEAYRLTIDGFPVELALPADTENGRFLFPLDPNSGIFNQLNAYYEWNKTAETLMIKADGTTFFFTIGNDEAIINAQKIKLYAAPYLFDGIPMIPLDIICMFTEGYRFDVLDGMSAAIRTPHYEKIKKLHDIIAARIDYQWEFELDGDKENWAASNVTASAVKDGVFYGVTPDNANDPLIAYSISAHIDADRNTRILVRMKHTLTHAQSSSACIYFAPPNQSLGESMTVKVPIAKSSGGEFVEYEFDMSSNENWKGIIEKIRFDPFSTAGEFLIDYIRVVE